MTTVAERLEATRWQDAGLAAALLAIDPVGLGGIALRAAAGPVRDRWLESLAGLLPPGMPLRRLPAGICDDRLLGGLDLAATLEAGRRVVRPGLLAEADGGLIVVPMAERLEPEKAGRIAAAMDNRRIGLERDGVSELRASRFGLILLDESRDDETGPPPALLERLAFRVDLDGVALGDAGEPLVSERQVRAARDRLQALLPETNLPAALCEAAATLGIGSLRAPLFALRAAAAHAALRGSRSPETEDAELAGRLVLAPRATRLPAPPEEPPPEEPDAESPTESGNAEQDTDPRALQDLVVDAARAVLPPDLLTALALREARRSSAGAGGRSGALRRSRHRGRPIGSLRGRLEGGARLHLLDTLRAAAPWQPLRRREVQRPGLAVRPDDLRITRFKQRSETAVIFVVDASGSAALARLAEAKGAVELLLADAYARRDQVALIAFRGQTAELLLPPTRSLARAKRSLSGLAGGGGTPLATAFDSGAALALTLRRQGLTPILVFLTDGQANVGRDSQPGRAAARADALAAAQALAATGLTTLLVDTSPRPRPAGRELAAALGARYLPLPRADATALSRTVRGEATA